MQFQRRRNKNYNAFKKYKMSKLKYLLILVVILSCRSSKDEIESSFDMLYLVSIIEEFKLKCTDTNELETHVKAKFNPADSTLTFFIGRSHLDYSDKWIIKLKNSIFEIDSINKNNLWKEVKIKTTSNQSAIKYYAKEDLQHENLDYFNLYIYDWCDKKEQKNFIASLKRIIELSKLQ
jgi:hypothetical protein